MYKLKARNPKCAGRYFYRRAIFTAVLFLPPCYFYRRINIFFFLTPYEYFFLPSYCYFYRRVVSKHQVTNNKKSHIQLICAT
jgi:hypothetical protein